MSWKQQVAGAIASLKERMGSSLPSIKKALNVDQKQWRFVNKALKDGTAQGVFTKTKGKYKVVKVAKKKVVKKKKVAKKKKVVKKKKKATKKKATKKKATKKKSHQEKVHQEESQEKDQKKVQQKEKIIEFPFCRPVPII